MTEDKYTALWVSYSSITDFLSCPRAYYLKNIYRDPSTNNKIQITSAPLSLGSAVHEVIDILSLVPLDKRFEESFNVILDRVWSQFSGKKGGFVNKDVEQEYKNKAQKMLSYLYQNPGPIKKLAVKIQMDLPYFWLDKKENIILCGKIDWLEYLKEQDAVHIIDFKTGKRHEKADSLQLPIYYLLTTNCQSRPVLKQSYWYLDEQKPAVSMPIPSYEKSEKLIKEIALKIKTSRKLNSFRCPTNGCMYCTSFEKILNKQAEFVGTSSRNVDLYILAKQKVKQADSIIL